MRTGITALKQQGIQSQYRDLQRRLDARAVLEHYGAENCHDETNASDGTTEVIHSCLLDQVERHHANADANPSACLAGDTLINIQQGKKNQWTDKRAISEIHRLWHEGIPHRYKEGRGYRQTPQGRWTTYVTHQYEKYYLGTFDTEAEAKEVVERFRDEHPYKGSRRYSRNVRVRSWDVDGDFYGRIGHVSDVWQTGVRTLLGITTESGRLLRCTAEHRVFSGEGWVTAGEIRPERDWLYREGRGRDYTKPERQVSARLRIEIGIWTQQQRQRLILPIDRCHVCGEVFRFEELQLDHIVPVVCDLTLAFTDSNLRPICGVCHRAKSDSENSFRKLPGTKVKALPDRVVKVEILPSEMTYDMEVSDWGNLTANGLVVHNSCNVDKNLYVCYSYEPDPDDRIRWKGDLIHLIMKMEGKESLDAVIPVVSAFLGESTTDTETFTAELDRLFHTAERDVYSAGLQGYSERILAPWAFVHPYVLERGIDRDTVSRLHIGWSELDNRITIPHFWNGSLVGWQLRAIPDRPGQWPGTARQQPKYLSCPGFPKSETLYHYDAATFLASGRVVVVESPFSVAKAVSLGVDGVVATFGAKVSHRQIDLLKSFREVIVWADADDAGRIMERKITSGLWRHTNVRVVTPEQGVDLGDYTTAESVQNAIDAAVPALNKMVEWDKEHRHGR